MAGIDHVGGTIFDLRPTDLAAQLTAVSVQTVRTRASDLSSVIDALLDPAREGVPEGLRGKLDPERVGTYGHSMGGFAVAVNQVEEPRVKAAAFLAIPPTGALPSLAVQTPPIGRFRVPALYVGALEDATVSLLGGQRAIRDAYEKQKPAAWLVEIADVGHFALADDLSIHGQNDGCGSAARVTRPRERFTNLAPALARDITARYVTAFFAHQFLAAPEAPLREAVPADVVTTQSRR